jgi:predicted metalloprotease with PDZ domain
LRPGDLVDPAGDPPAEARRGRRAMTLRWPDERPVPPPGPRGLSLNVATVVAVAQGSPAEAAGILVGERIVRVGGRAVANPAAALDRAKGPIAITVERNGRRRETLLEP